MTATSPTGNWAILADSGPLFAAVDPKDQYHLRAQIDLKRLEQEGRQVMVAYPILWECHALLLRRRGSVTASSWLTEVTESAISLAPSDDDHRAALRRLVQYKDQPITLFDSVLAVMSERLAFPVWTYDHHVDVMSAAVWR